MDFMEADKSWIAEDYFDEEMDRCFPDAGLAGRPARRMDGAVDGNSGSPALGVQEQAQEHTKGA